MERHVALPRSRTMDHTRVCNYLGYLKNERDSVVAVTGCADEKNPEGKIFITLISNRSRYQKSFSLDLSGNVESIQRMEDDSRDSLFTGYLEPRNANTFVEGDEIGDNDAEIIAQNTVIGGGTSIPYAIKAKLELGIDESAKDTIAKRFNTTVDAWLSEVLTHVQAHYRHPTLRHRINFQV